MKIKSVTAVGRMPVYDLSINSEKYDEQQYILKNGVVSHNTGIYYSASTIWILGRRQQKTGTEVTGYEFVINVEKSRYVKEKSKIPITVTWEGGIETYSGLIDVAMAGNFVQKPKNGWYAIVDRETGELGQNKRLKDTMNAEFWDPLLSLTAFQEFIRGVYKIGYKSTLTEEFLGNTVQE